MTQESHAEFFLAALAALRRARRRAERVARETNTLLVEMVDGKIVHVPPPTE